MDSRVWLTQLYCYHTGNGQREITEKTFKVDAGNFAPLTIFLLIVPYGIYTWSRAEFLSGTDRRYHDVV